MQTGASIPILSRLWPRSLRNQVLLAIALALLLAQGLSAVLLYRAQHDRREGALLHAAAGRILRASRIAPPPGPLPGPAPERERGETRAMRVEWLAAMPLHPGEERRAEEEAQLTAILAEQDFPVAEAAVVRRSAHEDQSARARIARMQRGARGGDLPDEVLVAAVRPQGSVQWLVARVFVPEGDRLMLRTLLLQTLFIYAVLVGAMALILRRITSPLALLTRRLEAFAGNAGTGEPLAPQGPDDVRRLIVAHNAMEGRIAALLDEKDVMLGAIGHDLKTPLAALRVRIESVEDDSERARMATTIEDITRTLDDILSLARVGRPSDPQEPTELSALVASVVEEYEDMGEPVTLADTRRVVATLRPTWVRRALRNLIGNALRYGGTAHVALERDALSARIRITDEGPGIPPDQLAAMLEPFTRGEPSRNSETGGAGLGLTLARAIAEQHGGTLALANRVGPDGKVRGLEAVLTLPLG